jgi:hypothetical protein
MVYPYTRRRFKNIIRISNKCSSLFFFLFQVYCILGMGHETMQNKLSKEKEDKNPSIQKKDSS